MELKEQAIKNLRDFKKAAEQVGMPFMMMEGNLLGFYYKGDFCDGDEGDIDLGIHERHFHKVDKVIKLLELQGFEHHKRFMLGDSFEGGAIRRGGNHIDLMNMHTDDDTVYNFGRCPQGLVVYEYPAEMFNSYDTITYLDMTFLTPSDIKGFLDHTYGEWNPEKAKNYCYYDKKYRPNVKLCK